MNKDNLHCAKSVEIKGFSGPYFPVIYNEKFETFTNRKNKKCYRSSYRRCFLKKMFLEISQKFTGKTPVPESFFNKFARLRSKACIFILKESLSFRCFSVSFAKFPRTFFLQNTSMQLLLNAVSSIIMLLWG